MYNQRGSKELTESSAQDRKLEARSFGSDDELGRLLRELTEQVTSGLDLQIGSGPGPAYKKRDKAASSERWDSGNLKDACFDAGFAQQYPRQTPDRIDLGSFRGAINLVSEKAHNSTVEWGIVGFACLDSNSVKFPWLVRGGPKSVMLPIGRVPRGESSYKARPVIQVHSHPDSSPYGLHFSPQDIAALLAVKESLAGIVTYRGRSLMVMKTTGTLDFMSEERLERELERIARTVQLRVSPDVAARAFTEEMCIQFGLSLFLSNRDHPAVFKKVNLRGLS